MSLKEKIISGINEIRTGNKITYECLLLLSSTDLAKWQLAVGESAPWIAPDAEIRSLNKTYLADGSWTLRVIAEISARNKVCPTIRLNENDILQTVEESYDVSAVFFPLEWFGCRTATAADCPPFTDTSMETISGGKTKYVMYIDLIGTWIFGVPLGLLAAFVWNLSIPYVYFILSLEECVRFAITLVIFRSRKWINILDATVS